MPDITDNVKCQRASLDSFNTTTTHVFYRHITIECKPTRFKVVWDYYFPGDNFCSSCLQPGGIKET